MLLLLVLAADIIHASRRLCSNTLPDSDDDENPVAAVILLLCCIRDDEDRRLSRRLPCRPDAAVVVVFNGVCILSGLPVGASLIANYNCKYPPLPLVVPNARTEPAMLNRRSTGCAWCVTRAKRNWTVDCKLATGYGIFKVLLIRLWRSWPGARVVSWGFEIGFLKRRKRRAIGNAKLEARAFF